MPARKRTSQGDDTQPLPLREKRRKTEAKDETNDEADSKSPSQTVDTRSGHEESSSLKVPIRLHGSASPETTLEAARGSHKRFGSEDPVPNPQISREDLPSKVEDASDDSDDDEAPEAISHSHAAAESKALHAEEARLSKRKADETRDKRRKRDAELKSQSRKSQRREREGSQYEDEDKPSDLLEQRSRQYDMDNLPALLPDELLATEAPIRQPTPPQDDRISKVQKLESTVAKLQEEDEAEEVIHNGTRIQVLQSSNKLLPPKANGKTHVLREAWLQGRASFEKVNRRGSNMSKFRRRPGPQAFV